MPVSKDVALKVLHVSIANDTQNRLIRHVDELLLNPIKLKERQRGTDEAPYWFFAVRGTLSFMDKAELVEKYTAVGWSRVVAYNSEDKGEVPGMCSLTLYV